MTPDFARRSYQEIVAHLLDELTAQGVLTDTAPGSVTRTLVEATSREFAELYARMNAVYEAGFLDTATGGSLDQLVALIGLTRLSGETDIVEIRLFRDTRVSARVVIPAGAKIVVDRPGRGRVTYAVLDSDELRAGEDALVVALRALPQPDEPDLELDINADDVAAGIASFVSPIAGIGGLAIEGPSVALGTNETDVQLRDRARIAIASAGGGTEKALEQALLEVEGVNGVRLRDAGDPVEGVTLRPGEIEVILDGDQAQIAANASLIEQAIARAKGPGIVARLGATTSVHLGGTLMIQPASATLSPAQSLKLVQDCEAVMLDAVTALEIGASLTWNRVLADLMAVENLGDVLVAQSSFKLIGRDPAELPLGNITMQEFERLVPAKDGDALAVLLEDQPSVVVSVTVQGSITAPDGPVADTFTAEVTRGVMAYLETLDTSVIEASLTHAGLLAVLQGAEGVVTLPEQITADSITITAVHQHEGSVVTLTAAGRTEVTLAKKTVLRAAETPALPVWVEEGL